MCAFPLCAFISSAAVEANKKPIYFLLPNLGTKMA
jgi:hypothetical protein